MIKVKISLEGVRLELDVQGHAVVPASNSKKVNEICVAVTTLSNTFVQSVSLLCELKPISFSSESGLLLAKWSTDFLENLESKKEKERRHALVVLIRSLQIGLENCRKIDKNAIVCEYNLNL